MIMRKKTANTKQVRKKIKLTKTKKNGQKTILFRETCRNISNLTPWDSGLLV